MIYSNTGQLTKIEYQREALENANTNTEVVKMMALAVQILKAVNVDVDKVRAIMDDAREQLQLAEEISQIISNPIGFGQEVDEDELMKELEEIEQEKLNNQILETGEPEQQLLPEVPSTAFPSTADKKSKSICRSCDSINSTH